MTGGWWVFGIGAAVLGWSVYVDARHRWVERLASRWVSRTRDAGRWVGPCSLAASAVALAGYAALAWMGNVLATSLGDPRWALVVSVPALLAYGPFVFATVPHQTSGYASWRSELRAAGADERHERRIAWWAGPPSLLGIVLMIITLVSIFLSSPVR